MSIKSKKWYENQIKALRNAERHTSAFYSELQGNDSDKNIKENNTQISAKLREIYAQLHKLEDEYWLYYR